MWGWLPGCLLLSGPWVVWAGRGCVRGRQLAVALASRLCGGGGGGWLPCVGVGDTPACFCFLLVCGGVGAGGCSRVRGVCVCGGGMLSGFWGSAPWLPDLSGAPGCWGFWVGVGGLVVNCIVDASILL